ncbi:hypothetical protein [Arthrobacter sp. efr-133-TYG-118]|uniref:hypothetical protein n=1 Tax=Arthrobacter sp. efr-133-TYG-118 TaxID=3040279 RepID=UPI00254C9AD9|nr:hypothetical protein [Arthrobacter sp. efr-133-TYG-118]
MFSQFMTWGDVREIQRQPGGKEPLPFPHFLESEVVELAKQKIDDEFFFELSSELIAEARRQRWPRVPREGESVRHEVTSSADGAVLLLLLCVDEEKYYYRANGEWIYVGPGDDVPGFFDENIYEVLPSFVPIFDAQSLADPDLTLPAIGSYVPNLHEHYLAKGSLGYFSYIHAPDGAYLLVTTYAPQGQLHPETTLFLITNKLSLRRQSGAWHEVDDDQIVGDNGEFVGSLISPLLESLAVSWWDSHDASPQFKEALAYCAAFPTFRFEVDVRGRVSNLLLETENGTWEIEESFWKQRQRTPPDDIEKQLGPRSLVSPSLAPEARDCILNLRAGTTPKYPASCATSFLEAPSFAQFVCRDQRVLALIVASGDVVWERERGQWSTADNARASILSRLPDRIDVEPDRLPEVVAWWDAHSDIYPDVDLIPENHGFRSVVRSQTGRDEEGRARVVNISVVDGKREWLMRGGRWTVGPLAEEFDEPDIDERLPDWFYNP